MGLRERVVEVEDARGSEVDDALAIDVNFLITMLKLIVCVCK